MKSKFPKIIAAVASVFGVKPEQVAALDSALAVELEETPAPAAEPVVDAAQVEADRLAAEKATAEKAEADKVALDAAIKTAEEAAEARVHALYAAREAVSAKVGITALDSAEATYRFALDKSGVTHASIAADALPALWESTSKSVAQDSAPPFVEVPNIFPSHIRKG